MNNYNIYKSNNTIIKGWTKGVPVDSKALDQLKNIASLPFIYKHVAAMPDVHVGMGATVGSVIPTKGAVIPAAVGVDIGCGMVAVKTDLTANILPDSLKNLRSTIEANIPHGRSDGSINDAGSWKGSSPCFASGYLSPATNLRIRFDSILAKHPKISGKVKALDQAVNMLGTLGTGNHFVEICLDENQDVWVMLHSGSRGIGNRIGRYFIELAKEDMKRYHINLPDKDLAYLPEGTQYFDDYIEAVGWAQDYAKINRRIMLDQTVYAMQNSLGRAIITDADTAVNCHHNYVTRENHFGSNVLVTRKGAVCARKGTMGIIPGSMGARSYIVRGLGNTDSFHSCSHGAGRVMSRSEAKNTLRMEDHIRDTEGVECRKDINVIDESPAAYKDINAVMEAQKDLVEVVHTLKQIVCVKG